MIYKLKHLAYVLKVNPKELERIPENIDRYYYERSIPKYNQDGSPKISFDGSPKVRIINPSTARLKVIQSRILKRILNRLPIPDYAYGGVSGRDNVANAKRHQGKKFKFQTDIQNFFPSISYKRVYEMFRTQGFSPDIARILTQLTTYKGRLPQGTPTSPLLSNLVFIEIGNKLQDLAADNDITFSTFIDDLSFSSSVDFKYMVPKILDVVVDDGFRINPKKTFYKSKPIDITGVSVRNNMVDVTDEFKMKLSNSQGKTQEQIKGELLYRERVLATNN